MRTGLPLYQSKHVRAIDAAAIEGGTDGYTLMGRAADAALKELRARWPGAQRLLVVCGAGNNGGDAYVLARLAHAARLSVHLLSVDQRLPSGEDAIKARASWLQVGGEISVFEPGKTELEADVVVDGLIGIGLRRPPAGNMAELIAAINESGVPVLALDVPSGVDADRGCIPGVAIRAQLTVTFIASKAGLLTGPALDHVGDLVVHSLGLSNELIDSQPILGYAFDRRALSRLPKRQPNGHKGRYGHVLAVGGDDGTGGAIRLCVEAALRSGAGLVSALTRTASASALLVARPEAMTLVDDEGVVPAAASRASVLALGPGLGQTSWGKSLFAALIDDPRPMVIDADALNLLAQAPRPLRNRVLTPHPGEAARLLDCSTQEIQNDRYGALNALVDRYQSVVVLKGAGTLVAGPGSQLRVIRGGNPGMASGGMGDLLTGIIAALLAQGLVDLEAAFLGALLHAVAGDDAARAQGARGLLATDLLPFLRGDFSEVHPAESGS